MSDLVVWIVTFVIVPATVGYPAYKFGYSKGARHVINEWKSWLNETQED